MATPPTEHPGRARDPRRRLDATRLSTLLRDWDWPDPSLVEATPSTNADVGRAARDGAPTGTVEAAELQTAGRGRLGRSWDSPPGAGLTFSLLVRPVGVDPAAWGWLPLMAGVAVATALREESGVPLALKWPNDLVVAGPDRGGGPGPRKLGGILVEQVGDAAGPAGVIGVGLDVDQRADELPVATATSLALEGAVPRDREELLAAALLSLRGWYGRWAAAGGDAERSGLAAAYRSACLTLGEDVRVEQPGGEVLEGRASDVDALGRLLVVPPGEPRVAVAAGDVLHLRGG